ncbi:hypothetical protein [Clostridium butyricum]|uniref:hypothetical protein n=1 Tax=Clostridium butyricum TaxID=1492 RepID=UPI00374F2B59
MILKEGSKITLIKDNGILQQDENDFDFNIHMLNKIDSFILDKDIEISSNETIVVGSKNFICSKIEESIIKGNYILHGHFYMTVKEILELLPLIFIGAIFISIALSIMFKGTITIPSLF